MMTWLAQFSAGFLLFSLGSSAQLPTQAQLIDQRTFNVLNTTLPPAEFNATSVSTFHHAIIYYY